MMQSQIHYCGAAVDRCPSLLCDIFDLTILTTIYRCSHLLKNGGSKVVHLITETPVTETEIEFKKTYKNYYWTAFFIIMG